MIIITITIIIIIIITTFIIIIIIVIIIIMIFMIFMFFIIISINVKEYYHDLNVKEQVFQFKYIGIMIEYKIKTASQSRILLLIRSFFFI